ncbi:hypothetical protein WJU23_11395 [Prosthecobacter sp. SYSU 5D2]|uniref:hypothetical protein n=1 Tax=Prosthecobacter sp. SYSU 5D2 TaxID=3134134 RepID=UPI0031FE69E0
MNIKEKSEAAISSILAATRNGDINWVRVDDPPELNDNTEDIVKTAYYGKHKSQSLAVYTLLAKRWLDEDYYVWDSTATVAICAGRKPVWEFPYTIFTEDLHEAVVLKGCDIEGKLEELIDEDFC